MCKEREEERDMEKPTTVELTSAETMTLSLQRVGHTSLSG